MPTKQQILSGIPTEEQANQAVEDFKSEGCNPVIKEKQSDGKWTVTATCPEA